MPKLIYRHRSVSPSRIGKNDTVAYHTSEYNEVVVAI